MKFPKASTKKTIAVTLIITYALGFLFSLYTVAFLNPTTMIFERMVDSGIVVIVSVVGYYFGQSTARDTPLK